MNPSSRSFTVRVPANAVDDHVAAFRTALELFGTAELTEFLPPSEDSKRLEILCELVRLELGHGWKIGRPTSLDTYQIRYPELRAQPVYLYRIAMDEFHHRRSAGENPSMAEYRQHIEFESQEWPSARVNALDPETSSKLDIALAGDDNTSRGKSRRMADGDSVAQTPNDSLDKTRAARNAGNVRPASDPEIDYSALDAKIAMPKIGQDFLDFFLLGELGRGAFGKVFLAQQGPLAGRLVALKVAMGLFTESQTLAQLQHTNIVPIYSYHHGDAFQAVCMPYLGSTTLAHVLANIRSHKCMPSSGKQLLSTLKSAKRESTQADRSSQRSSLNSGPIRTEAATVDFMPGGSAAAPHTALLELEGLSYVDSILWLAVRLTDGLAHAHERGIIHRDLKPANVLITDDGMPMLLDFNLAHDTKLSDGASSASMGGTLPYMAPEHLQAFHGSTEKVDARSDLYSLGVMLFELLTGASPFPTYRKLPMCETVERMVQDRLQGSPPLMPLNPNIPPAVESIILRCLEADPAKRYQTARDLQEDLQRQLEHKPLKHAANPSLWERWRKFRRRHPRLTSTASVAVAAGLVIAALTGLFVIREDQRTRLAARETLARFRDDAQTTYFHLNARTAKDQLDEGERACRAALAHYQVLENPDWQARVEVQRLPSDQQQKLQEEAGQLLVLLAHAQQLAGENEIDPDVRTKRYQAGVQFCSLAGNCFREDQTPQALWQQKGELFRRLNEREKAEMYFERARQSDLKNAHDRFLAARLLAEEGKFRDALPLVEQAIVLNPQDYHLHFLQGICHDYLGQNKEAVACYRTCIALKPGFFGAYYNRGLSYLRQSDHKAAVNDFDHAARLKADFPEIYLQRALAYQGLKKYREAIADLTTALDQGYAQTRVYFLRAKLREKTRDIEGAKEDFDEGLRREPTDELSWISRGIAYLPEEPKRALADFDKALTINPRSFAGLTNKAHVLGKYFKRTEEAVRILDKAIELYPDDVRPLAGRGICLARLGKREAALKDAEQALLLDTNPPNLYQVAGIYALTSRQTPDDQQEALRLLASALKKGFGHEYLDIDRDLDPIRESPTFRRVIEASRILRSAVPGKR